MKKLTKTSFKKWLKERAAEKGMTTAKYIDSLTDECVLIDDCGQVSLYEETATPIVFLNEEHAREDMEEGEHPCLLKDYIAVVE